LQYIPKPQDIISIVNQEDEDFRKGFTRGKQRRKFHALHDREIIIAASDKFKDDILGLIPLQPFSRNSSLTFRPELRAIRSGEGFSPESNKSVFEEENKEKNEYETKPEILSLIQEDLMEDRSNITTSSPKLRSLRFREFSSHYMEMTKGELTRSQLKKKKPEFVFDKVKIYSRYFPHNNVDNIIRRINKPGNTELLFSIKQDKAIPRNSTHEASKINCSIRNPTKARSSLLVGLSSLPNLFKKETISPESLRRIEHS